MNICIVSMANAHDKQIGGKHIHQLLLEKAYCEQGHNVITVYPGKKKIISRIVLKINRSLSKESNAKKFITHCTEIRKELTNMIIKILRRSKDEIVFLSQDTISALAVKDALSLYQYDNVHTALTLHGYFTREELNYQNFDKDREHFIMISIGWEREAVMYVDKILTVDTRIRNYVIDELKVDPSKISVIYNSINDSLFRPANKDEVKHLRKKHNLPIDKNIILVARRLVKKNGVHQALYAMEQIDESFNVLMVVIGDGPERDNLLKIISEKKLEKKVLFLGEIKHSQIVDYYRLADIILLPSTKSDNVEEATSLSMLEGMACGKVVIVSAIGGMKEVIKDNVNGYLFEDKNIPDLVKKIKLAIINKNESERISNIAREYVVANNGYLEHANRYLSYACGK